MPELSYQQAQTCSFPHFSTISILWERQTIPKKIILVCFFRVFMLWEIQSWLNFKITVLYRLYITIWRLGIIWIRVIKFTRKIYMSSFALTSIFIKLNEAWRIWNYQHLGRYDSPMYVVHIYLSFVIELVKLNLVSCHCYACPHSS